MALARTGWVAMSANPRVLIVDDNPAARGSVLAYLQDEGFELLQAGSAAQAMEILAAQPIDVAIIDLRLGDSDGERVILQAHAIRPGTRFLLYTASATYQVPASLGAVGMTDADV